MPNYRNKNRNRNKNKQRNKQQQQAHQNKNCKKDSEETTSSSPIPPTGHESVSPPPPPPPPPHAAIDVEVNKASALLNENVAVVGDNCNELVATENVQTLKEPDVTTVTATSDTVSKELAKCYNNEKNHGLVANDIMGNEKSKIKENLSEISLEHEEETTNQNATAAVVPSNCAQGKVIVHRLICEDLSSETNQNDAEQSLATINTPLKEINQQTTNELATHIKTAATTTIKKATRSETKTLESPNINQKSKKQFPSPTSLSINEDGSPTKVKVIIHKVLTPAEEVKEKTFAEVASPANSETCVDGNQHQLVTNNNSVTNGQKQVNVIIHNIATPEEEVEDLIEKQTKSELPIESDEKTIKSELAILNEANNQEEVKVIIHRVHVENEHEDPTVTSSVMSEPLLSTSQVKIVEMELDESLSDLEELKSPVISEAESSIEYCDDTVQLSDSITEISSSSSSQKQSRKQKRIALENHFIPQMINPRFLDSISEENSELSDNSENPLSRSASADGANNTSDAKAKKLNAVFPKSALDFSKTHKHHSTHLNSKVIREEPLAMAVSARLQDAPDADESCTTLRSCMSPEAEVADVVFINLSASSSMSDLHDIDSMEGNDAATIEFNLDTDLKDLIIKPTTESVCFKSLTSSLASSSSPSFENTTTEQQLPEFGINQKNNKQINNSKLVNNTPQTHFTPLSSSSSSLSTSSISPTTSLAETVTFTSSPANAQLAFAQIEEQISSVLSSINEAISLNTSTTTATTISSHLSNTQNYPVTTKSASRMLQTSCESLYTKSSLRADNNAKPSQQYQSENVNMNTVRDLINNNDAMKTNGNNNSATNGHMEKASVVANNNKTNTTPPPRGSPPPPPIPPPPQSIDEYDSGSSCSTSIPLLQKNVDFHNTQTQRSTAEQHDYPPQSLTSALGLLTSPLARQESMDSHCSSSTNFSQCTAINVARDLSSDIVKPSSISDLKLNITQQRQNQDEGNLSPTDPKKLRLLCAETVAALPYGDEVLEELAAVAQNIGEARAANLVTKECNMPYPLPELPHIDDLQLSLEVGPTDTSAPARPEPPLSDQSWLGVPTTQDPKLLVCLSPSQRSYIQQKPDQRPDDLLDAHQKFVERRGYHEYTKEQLQILEKEKLAEQQLLQTAAVMKKLRKSITPPPPQLPPPPVPVKSSKTVSKAQNLSKQTVNANIITHTVKTNNDVNLPNDNEHTQSASSGEHNGEENKHRLLSIMQDTNESQANNKQMLEHHSSSFENNSRQSNQSSVNIPAKPQVPLSTTLTNGISKTANQFPQTIVTKGTGNMQSVEMTLGQMFPTMGAANIFDEKQKRFSNIESFSREPYCSQIMETQPKRYSSVETHSYETKKRMENGKVIEDYSTSKHETENTGDKPKDNITPSIFPLKPYSSMDSRNSFLDIGDFNKNSQTKGIQHDIKTNTDDQEIMSALKLNKHSADRKTETETTIKTATTESAQSDDYNKEKKSVQEKTNFVKKELENTILKRSVEDTYDEFRQRAKAAADAVSTLPTLNTAATETTAKVASNGENGEMISSAMSSSITTKKTTTLNHDHEKLFKEFEDLSKQLHKELETSKAQREQREKSASMFDLNRVQLRQRDQIEEFNKSRHDHMKELEQQIERSMRSRSTKFTRPNSSADVVDYQYGGRTYEIPIHIENGNSSKSSNTNEDAPPVPEPPRTYQIPIHIDKSSDPIYEDDTRFRRAESMFNLGDNIHARRERTYSNQQQLQRAEDDWSKYASDLGSSENIVRPFAKEVEICYQRRPGGIRAPRISASTNDLSYSSSNQSYDQHNAYNVRRSHAPMLNRAPQHSRPQFGSCFSMIERDPNPKYISTTTRRGVSPAPQTSGFFPLDNCHVKEEHMRQRRASLPRELHEQQLKYITSKEEELRTEFERLQNERKRLMEEAHKAQVIQMAQQEPTSPLTPTRPLRDPYRSTQKLPTLTEDEVFRQQMAEEWLNKVAEREKRRLQNIIKISKITEDDALSTHKVNMEEEFLSRVKERRCKLAMPADSDWESGAESHPNNQSQLSESEELPPVKVIEGKSETNLRRLPPHLREFAKFSNHQSEKIEGGHREQHQEEESSHETTDNSVSKAFKKSTVVKTVKTLRAPMLAERSGGHDTKLHYHKPRAYQIPKRIRDSQSSDRDRDRRQNPSEPRRPIKQTRFAVPASNRRSWSESDLLEEINKELNLAKGFLFQDEKAQSPSMFAPKFKAKAPTGTGTWTPKTQTPTSSWSSLSEYNKSTPPTPPLPPIQPVWTPQASPQSNRKEFRPVHFESPTLSRRKYVISTSGEPTLPPWNNQHKSGQQRSHPQSCTNLSTPTSNASDTTNNNSHLDLSEFSCTGLPKSSISDKIKTFERSASASDLYTRPHIIRLTDKGRPLCKPNEVIYNVKHEYLSEPETDNERPRKMAQLGRRQYDGIGPITNDGMPIILRSEVKEPHQHEWYKRLYQTIHKQKHGGRNQYTKPNGYQSEPERNYDSDYSTIKYRSVNPNRLQSVSSALNVRNSNDTLYGTLPHPVKSGQNSYKNQPGRIEDYVTGHSSVSEKEKKEQFDQSKLSSHYTEGNLSRALAKESGYTSDSNLVFRKKEIPPSSPLSPVEQKQAYKNVQAGGEPPLFGFRKPAPEKFKDYDFPSPQLPPPPKGELLEQGAVSPNHYYESDVNIHFKSPVRQELKYPISEEELAIRQAEQMQKLYQEERRRKYLQELQDMNSRRHTDNFTQSQKSPIPLNRYDDFPADLAPKTANQIKSIARALYNFQAQNSKELSFKKGDIIYVKRAIDKNWYEGEHNAMIGLFPANYVEIINEPVHHVQPQQPTYRKPSEGQARAKYNFQAQSGVELSLNKGELVALTRRVDDNWFEGRIANRKGIFPVSYVEVLTDIGAEDIAARTTTIQQASVVNARPSLDALRTNINNEFNTLTRNGNQPPNAILRETRNGHKTDILHVDTSSDPLVYRALYKYRPQNSDELELQESDLVHVLEKCDDGWYVGTSQRTGCFGTFPGNYVERV